jgi:hypothetical protein
MRVDAVASASWYSCHAAAAAAALMSVIVNSEGTGGAPIFNRIWQRGAHALVLRDAINLTRTGEARHALQLPGLAASRAAEQRHVLR